MTTHPAQQFVSLIAAPAVVVELVGPSASGKSTLARAIAEANPLVQLAASARPAEHKNAGGASLPPSLARAAKLLRGNAPRASQDVAARLMQVLPPSGMLWRFRYRRYLAELSWRVAMARRTGGITVFDQGLVTAVGTLAAFGQRIDRGQLLTALELVPKPDLVIGMVTEREVVAQRLAARLGGQSPAERMFELNLSATLRQVEIFREMAPLLTANRIRTIWVESDGPESLVRARDLAMAEIDALYAEQKP